jgi:serine O-acetyltransferase
MMRRGLLNESLEKLTDAILASYDSHDGMQRIGETFLPSRTRIVEILDETRQLLFPGYLGHKPLTRENVRYYVGSVLVRLGTVLAEEITHCLCTERRSPKCDDPAACPDTRVCMAEAETMTCDFLAQIPHVRQMLALDAQAAYDGDPAAKSIREIIYCYPGFYAVTVYRIAHELHKVGVPLMPRIMSEHAHSVTGTDIHPGAQIGRSFFIDHATGVVIGETTKIGDNVKMYQGVTLGAKSFPKDERGRVIKGLQRHPTIEDDVTIYPNATILGGQTVIGRGSTVGGNTYITSSIEAGSLVRQDGPRLEVLNKMAKSTGPAQRAS